VLSTSERRRRLVQALCADLEAAGISAKSYLASLDSMKQVRPLPRNRGPTYAKATTFFTHGDE
jgi:hypothetical protein